VLVASPLILGYDATASSNSKSQPLDNKLSLKGAWSLSHHLFYFWKISDNISKQEYILWNMVSAL